MMNLLTVMRMWLRMMACEIGGHQLAHRAMPAYRDRLNYCTRCEALIHVRALKDVSE